MQRTFAKASTQPKLASTVANKRPLNASELKHAFARGGLLKRGLAPVENAQARQPPLKKHAGENPVVAANDSDSSDVSERDNDQEGSGNERQPNSGDEAAQDDGDAEDVDAKAADEIYVGDEQKDANEGRSNWRSHLASVLQPNQFVTLSQITPFEFEEIDAVCDPAPPSGSASIAAKKQEPALTYHFANRLSPKFAPIFLAGLSSAADNGSLGALGYKSSVELITITYNDITMYNYVQHRKHCCS